MKEARAAQRGEHVGKEVGPSKRARFTTRHTLILYMDLAGERNTDIALKLGMHPNSVSALKSSPLYQLHRTQLLEALSQNKLDSLLDLIRNDAVKNVEFAINVRDNDLEETKNRLGAARMLSKEVDRVYPRITKSHHTEERVVRITLGQEKLGRIANALRELGDLDGDALDADFYDPNAPDPAPAPISAQTLDEVRQELLDAAQRTAAED